MFNCVSRGPSHFPRYRVLGALYGVALALTARYCALPLLQASDPFGDWSYMAVVRRALGPLPLLLGLSLDVAGQVLLWRKGLA
ncbi:MAG: hypothetical protein EHM18_12225 [Acidobacteria bacterium]|nr:MAG: hypothetical protein EHM18_12225 [Acidobacteriota bacterium]